MVKFVAPRTIIYPLYSYSCQICGAPDLQPASKSNDPLYECKREQEIFKLSNNLAIVNIFLKSCNESELQTTIRNKITYSHAYISVRVINLLHVP